MKSFRLIAIFILALALLYQYYAPVSSPDSRGAKSVATQIREGIPPKAVHVLEIVRETGHAPSGYVGGRIFQNREHRLPSGGDYREFDVDPHEGPRNAERIIVDWRTRKAWYTGDHYQTFIPMP